MIETAMFSRDVEGDEEKKCEGGRRDEIFISRQKQHGEKRSGRRQPERALNKKCESGRRWDNTSRSFPEWKAYGRTDVI